MQETTTPPIGVSTVVAILTATAFALGAVAAAIEDRTPEAIGAAAAALGAVVTLVTSRTSQANALTNRRPTIQASTLGATYLGSAWTQPGERDADLDMARIFGQPAGEDDIERGDDAA